MGRVRAAALALGAAAIDEGLDREPDGIAERLNRLLARSHYDTVSATFTDSPGPNEVLVAIAVATRGRLHARLGGLKAHEIVGTDGLH